MRELSGMLRSAMVFGAQKPQAESESEREYIENESNGPDT
jgi:hypothetical protein